MVIDTRSTMSGGPPSLPVLRANGETYVDGERLAYRLGETLHQAFTRHRAERATAKPAGNRVAAKSTPTVDPKLAQLHRLRAELARTKESVAAKEQIDALRAERDKLRAAVAKRERKSKGFAGHIKVGGNFNISKRGEK